jgi:hypothetical protein
MTGNVAMALDDFDQRLKRLEKHATPSPNFPRHVYDVLSLLISQQNESAVKIHAAERVFEKSDPTLFDAYVKEIAVARRELNLRAPLEVLAPLKNNP